MQTDQPSEQHVPDDVFEMPVAALGRALRDGSLSPVDLAEAALQRIETMDGQVRAFVTVTRERALDEARQAERDLRAGIDHGLLHGLPLALKDLVATRGIRTTAGSQVLADYIPDEDAAVAKRLRAAGMVLLGKTRTHEFATASSARPPSSSRGNAVTGKLLIPPSSNTFRISDRATVMAYFHHAMSERGQGVTPWDSRYVK